MTDNKDKKEKKTYKELNGTTRVGDFLRSINFKKILGVGAALAAGNIEEAKSIILKDSQLSPEDTERALELLKLDLEELSNERENITKRWQSDMSADSWLSKNVRPLTLIFLTFATILLIYLDTFMKEVLVEESWITLLQTLLLGVYVSYFGSRGLEKIKLNKRK